MLLFSLAALAIAVILPVIRQYHMFNQVSYSGAVTVTAAGGDGDVDAVKDGGGRGAWKARNYRTMANTSLHDDGHRLRFFGLLSYACHNLHR